MQTLIQMLPETIQNIMIRLTRTTREQMEELRIREQRPLEYITSGQSFFLNEQGFSVEDASKAYYPTKEDCRHFLDTVTEHSVYSYEEQLKQGYITVSGGHRIGLCGKVLQSKGMITGMKEISSFNIRFAKEVKNSSLPMLEYLLDEKQTLRHTVIGFPSYDGKDNVDSRFGKTIE